MDIVYDLDDSDYQGSILNAVVRYLSRYSSYDEFLAEYVLSSDEGISSAIQGALHQLVLNQAVTALRTELVKCLMFFMRILRRKNKKTLSS